MEINQIPNEAIKGIEKMIYSKDGVQFIALGSYCLDFKHQYAFLGFTKNKTKVILGDIHTYGSNGLIQYTKKFGKVELRENSKIVDKKIVPYKYYQLVTDGYRYSEIICEVSN